jgi:predicted Fe-Mo cluster-binding NifX family protein
MILFISAQGETLESRFNTKFGRTPWFIRFDSDSGKWTALENSAPSQAHGAGVAAAQLLIDQGAQSVISGRFGPNAHQALSAAGIAMFAQPDDTLAIQDVIALWQADKLEPVH